MVTFTNINFEKRTFYLTREDGGFKEYTDSVQLLFRGYGDKKPGSRTDEIYQSKRGGYLLLVYKDAPRSISLTEYKTFEEALENVSEGNRKVFDGIMEQRRHG